jgi:hypothetical protein
MSVLNRQRAAVVTAALAAFLVLGLLFPGIIPFIGGPSDATPVATSCPSDEVHFYAADVEQNFFGPAVPSGTIDQQKQELYNRRCKDPALVVGHAHVWGMEGFAQLNSDAAFTAKIRELRDNHQLWLDTIKGLEERENASTASQATMSGSYETLYMVDGAQDVPLIRKAEPDRPSFAVLRFVYTANGHTVNYKLDCGFQPVGQFPGVPPVSAPQPPPPATAPPGTTPTTAPPVTTTTAPPGTTTTTPPTTAPKAPIDNGRGGPAPAPNVTPPTTTPGAPAQPHNPPAGPAPVEGTPAPAPLPGGYDSGSPTGSGTPAGSTCNTSGCTGGGPQPAQPGPAPVVDNGTNSTDTGMIP